MELGEKKARAPLHILVTITLLMLQLCAVTAQINESESSTDVSANSPTSTTTSTARFLSGRRSSKSSRPSSGVSLPGKFSFGFRWGKKRKHRRRHNKANPTSLEFLFAHNIVRARVGEPPLLWDGRLAAYARVWAAQRVGDCRLVHSNGPFGENIFWAGDNSWKPRDVVKEWADEDKFYNSGANTCQQDQMCGHYTQMVWRDTTKVGCAQVDCSNGGMYAICVYNPPGNYEGEHPFESHAADIGLTRDEPPATVEVHGIV